MQDNRWHKIEEIFEQAVTLDSENRRQFIEQNGALDEELKSELISLLENHEESGDFLLDDSIFPLGLKLL